MIIFKSIKFKNFLSYGNAWSEFKFTTGITRIMGKNGDGKSTITEAIYFALFGKAYRNINLGQLVNSINKKELEVILDFSIGEKDYRIERGIKPNYFRIFSKTEDREFESTDIIPVPSTTRTYQQILEEDILHSTSDIFEQTTLKSLTRNISFFTLKKADKRDITENILGIKIFSGMNKVCKGKVDALEKELISLNKDFDYNEILITQEKDNLTRLKQIKEQQEKDFETKKLQAEQEIVTYKEDIKKYEEGITRIQKYKTRKAELNAEHDALLEKKNEVQKSQLAIMSEVNHACIVKKAALQEQIKQKNEAIRIANNSRATHISKCDQDIDGHKKKIREIEKDINSLKVSNAGIQTKIDFMTKTCTDCPKAKELVTGIDGSIEGNNQQIANLQAAIAEHEGWIATLEQQKITYQEDYFKVEKDINQEIKDIQKLIEDTDNGAAAEIVERSTTIDTQLGELQSQMNALREPIQQCDLYINKEQGLLVNIERNKTEIQKREIFISKTAPSTVTIDTSKLKGYAVKRQELTSVINEKTDDKKHYAFIRTMLSDDAIKTFVIQKYLPVINKILNSYLQKFGSDVIFNFDAEFDEQIVSRHKDGFSYESFSEGQKRRIDLAVLFTFIEFCKIKFSNASNNLLILDEVGAGLDAEGDNILLEILRDLKEREEKNILTITHSSNLNPHRIDKIFECKLEKGFSKIEEKKI